MTVVGPLSDRITNKLEQEMPRVLPKYITEYLDRHGRMRRYFRYKGTRVPMPYRPGNARFDRYYKELLSTFDVVGSSPTNREQNGFVYFARCGNLIKIGFSTQPEKRLSELQIGSGMPIEIVLAVPATMECEHSLHKKFAALHVSGEWFSAAPSLLDHIEQIRQVRHRS